MKCLAQFPSILAIYCFCLLQIPSSGFPRPLADASDGLDIVKFERMAYWASLSRQPKIANVFHNIQDNQDIYKRFLFHYSRTQGPTHPVKTAFSSVHPLMHLAAKLADRRMKTFWRRDSRATAVDFTKKDYTATLGRPFFLFRIFSVCIKKTQGMEETLTLTPGRIVQEFNGKGSLDQAIEQLF